MPAPKNPAYTPAEYTVSEATAIQALAQGTATAEQQKIALDWIILKNCKAYDLPWVPEGDRESSFFAGRVFAGQQIIKLTKVSIAKLIAKEKKHERPTK